MPRSTGAVVRANQLKARNFRADKRVQQPLQPARSARSSQPSLSGDSRDRSDQRRHDDWVFTRLTLTRTKKEELDLIAHRLERLGIEGLICVGGDGTLNGLQPLAERLPTVLAPKTIDNDLGLNYPDEPDKWVRVPEPNTKGGYRYEQRELPRRI